MLDNAEPVEPPPYLGWLLEDPQSLQDLTHFMLTAQTRGGAGRSAELVIAELPAELQGYASWVIGDDPEEVPELDEESARKLLQALFARFETREDLLRWHARNGSWDHMCADWLDGILQLKGWELLDNDEDPDDDE